MLKDYDWNKLRQKNYSGKVYYSDCQVVSAVNAYYMLTGEVAYKSERAYRSLCKLAGAVHGSATSIEKVHKKLGLIRGKPRYTPFDGETKTERQFNCPVECTIWHIGYGFHSVLIVDRVKKCNAIRVTNFEKRTFTSEGWMFYYDLYHFLSSTGGNKKRTERCHPIRLV